MNFTRYIIKLIVLGFFCFLNIANAQESYREDDFTVSLKPFSNYVVIAFELKNNAVFYWRNPGELGVATKFSFENSSNLDEAKVFWPIPDIVEGVDVASYEYQKNTDFVVHLSPKDFTSNIQLDANLKFTICQNSCQNYNINLNQVIPVEVKNSTPGEILELLASTPKANNLQEFKISSLGQENIDGTNWLSVEIVTNENILKPKIFFDLPEYVHFEPLNYEVISAENKQIIRLPFKFNDNKHKHIDDNVYLVVMDDKGLAAEFEGQVIGVEQLKESFWWILTCAFIGGLILNVMPCVLPILALKMLQLIKLSEQKNLIRKSFIFQALGIIVTFVSFAIFTYVLQFFGHKVGFGMHFQQPIYLITMIIILSLIAISLLSEVNFTLIMPEFINRYIAKNNENASLFAVFMSGVLVTLLAIPCTAPFVTIAVGFALTTSLINMIIIFAVMGVGMSFPYILVALLPSAARFIPKPGFWMNSFKKFTGIIIFLTCLWLMYIISSQLGTRAAVTLFLLVLLLKFVINENQVLKGVSKKVIFIVLIGLCYVLPQDILDQNITHETKIEEIWQEYRPDDIASLIAENYVVVVDVTASWCATCSVNKFTTLNNSSVLSTMKKFKLIAMRADISQQTNQDVINLMRSKHHRGIPFTLVYSKQHPEGLELPTILTPHSFISAIKGELN